MYKKLFILFFITFASLWASGSVHHYSLQDLMHSGNIVLVVTPVSKFQELDVMIPYRDTNGVDQRYESKINYSEYKVEQVLALSNRSNYDGVGIHGFSNDSIRYVSSDEIRKLPNSEAAFLTHTIRVITQRSVINLNVGVRYEKDQVRKFPIYYSIKQELQPEKGDSSFILVCTPNYRYNSFEAVGLISIQQLDAVKTFLRSSKYGTRMKLFF